MEVLSWNHRPNYRPNYHGTIIRTSDSELLAHMHDDQDIDKMQNKWQITVQIGDQDAPNYVSHIWTGQIAVNTIRKW